MRFFKNFFSRQFERTKNISQGDELYFIFFRLAQVWTLVATFTGLVTLWQIDDGMPMIISLNSFSARIYMILALGGLISILLCEFGLHCLDQNKPVGLYLGLLISFKLLFGYSFLLGIFGIYAFLNPAAQKKYLAEAPPWVTDFLTFCRLNRLEKDAEPGRSNPQTGITQAAESRPEPQPLSKPGS